MIADVDGAFRLRPFLSTQNDVTVYVDRYPSSAKFGVGPSVHDGSQNRDPLNLIFPVYFDLMRQFSPISPEGSGEVFLH
jgi:hypothetical protein